MKKILLLACVAGLMVGSAVQAQDSTYWFDIRDNAVGGVEDIFVPTNPFTIGQDDAEEQATSPVNGGKEGAGVILRVHPICPNNGYEDDQTAVGAFTRYPNFDGDRNLSTGTLWLYVDVTDVIPCGDPDVISSIGLDFDLTLAYVDVPTAGRNPMDLSSYDWESVPWSDPNASTVAGDKVPDMPPDPDDWAGAKAVKVPVVTGPSYAAGTGVVANVYGSPWKIGKMDVVGGDRTGPYAAGHLENSTYAVRLQVNSLLITRVCSSGSHSPEMVAFGYDAAGNPETPLISGSFDGGTSALADALIQVHFKHDSTGDGVANAADIAVPPYDFLGIKDGAPHSQRATYTHDGTNDRIVNTADVYSFVTALTGGSGGCDL